MQWLTDEEQTAWRGLLHTTAALQARLGRELQRTAGLSWADYDVLVQLSEAPGGRRRIFELTATLQWEQSRVSHQLARMQRRGLVDREECPTDRRGAFVVLTPEGAAAIAAAAPAHVTAVRELVFDRLTPDDVVALARIARAVSASPGR